MNPTLAPEFAAGLTLDLRNFVALCEDVLALVTRENQALAGPKDYQSNEFDQKRKHLIPELESALITLRKRRQLWRDNGQPGGHSEEIKRMFLAIQSLLMKILFLDRENQRAMLRLGLVPTKHLPPVAAQQPHYVAGLYQRHSTFSGGRSA